MMIVVRELGGVVPRLPQMYVHENMNRRVAYVKTETVYSRRKIDT